MAHIKRMTDKPRALPWRAHIHRKGLRPTVKMFASEAEAIAWSGEQERSIRMHGVPLGNEALKDVLVFTIVQKYLDEITPTKSGEGEASALKRFRDYHKDKTLAYISKQDAYAYRDERLKAVKPSTVRREFNSIQHVFEVAKEQWGYDNLINPFRGIKIKGAQHRRKRRLQDGELERLEEACKSLRGVESRNRTYVPLAMYLAIETGMRLDEIFNLTWQDLNFKQRLIEIIEDKTDDTKEISGRTIVMPLMVMLIAERLKAWLEKQGKYKETDLIFPMSKDAFEQSFDHVLTRAKITADRRGERLQFRDLRREANSRFDQILTVAECELMLGHSGKETNSIYRSATYKSIRDKLDAHYELNASSLKFIRDKKLKDLLGI